MLQRCKCRFIGLLSNLFDDGDDGDGDGDDDDDDDDYDALMIICF